MYKVPDEKIREAIKFVKQFDFAKITGKLAEFKVDDENYDGSAAVHFAIGSQSPYDQAVAFDAKAMNWLRAYRYAHIK